jgi:hypothetical protein
MYRRWSESGAVGRSFVKPRMSDLSPSLIICGQEPGFEGFISSRLVCSHHRTLGGDCNVEI